MINYKELISSFTKEDYKNNLINLHIHTKYSDGKADFENIIIQAKEKQFKYIAISDHNTMKGYSTQKTSCDILIPAVEFDVWFGFIFCHILAYGINHNNPHIKPFLAKNDREIHCKFTRLLPTRNLKKLIEAIHNANGIAVLAHPACCWAFSLDKLFSKLKNIGLDGAEVYYPYERHRGIIKFHKSNTVEKYADKHGLIKTGGTDLHGEILK